MKLLPTEFRYDGFDHKQIWRHGPVALYQKSKPTISYEVIIIQVHKAYRIGNTDIEAGEHYPRSEQWGTAGWTYMTREDAEKKASALLAQFKAYENQGRT